MYWKIGCISGALSVLLGAFGSHGLRERVDARALEVWETGVRYQFYHSVGICLSALRGNRAAGGLFLSGIVLFSGSLYGIVLTGNRRLGMITPVGGLGLAAGWLALGFM
jgi:uncharacterized membrane protein YgdD (TMEM256/DUF423 family)